MLLEPLALAELGFRPKAAGVAQQVLREGDHAFNIEFVHLYVVELELAQGQLPFDAGEVLLVGLLVGRPPGRTAEEAKLRPDVNRGKGASIAAELMPAGEEKI